MIACLTYKQTLQSFINGAMRELPETMILQMMGRAGRQQYNKSGRVYIMTKQERIVSNI